MDYEPEELEEENQAAALKKLKDKLKQCQSERQEYLETSQRLRADYVNLRRTIEQERERMIQFANEDLLTELIAVTDSFDQAFAAGATWAELPVVWRLGLEQISAKLHAILSANGVETIDPLGAVFDPNEHQAIQSVDTDKAEEDNVVLAVMQRGYRLRDKIIRPAMVKVGRKE